MSTDPKPWQRIDVPPEVARVPAMLTAEERRYLIWTTAVACQGGGAVVDLGPWLGGSSTALAEGLRRSGRPGKVHCRDLFSWSRSYMPGYCDVELPDGADFMPLFREQTAAYRDLIDVRQMDLTRAEWSGEPIELLFVDAAKSWELLNEILRVFAPCLEPGVSRVVLQDFRHAPTYFIPLVFDGRPDLWEEVEAVDHGTTVTFRLRRAFDPTVLPYDEASFPFAAARAIFAARIAAAAPAHRTVFELALLVKAVVEGERDVADELRAAVRRELPDRDAEEHLAAAEDCAAAALSRQVRATFDRDGPAAAEEMLARIERRIAEREWIAVLREQLRLHAARAGIEAAARELAAHRYAAANAEILAALGRLRPAEPLVRSALSLLEQVWTAEQDADRALGTLRELAPRFDGDADFHVLAAIVARHRGRTDEALEALVRALRLAPAHADALRLRAEWS
ncbi:MAG: tetratricopeptide repeat protein [Planctomycetes bacterium]|nr:tetratricopeptide repeat protein [Planctomycetota bacterium]